MDTVPRAVKGHSVEGVALFLTEDHPSQKQKSTFLDRLCREKVAAPFSLEKWRARAFSLATKWRRWVFYSGTALLIFRRKVNIEPKERGSTCTEQGTLLVADVRA